MKKLFYCYYVLHAIQVVYLGKFIKAKTPEEAKERFTRFVEKTGLIIMTEYIQLEVEEV